MKKFVSILTALCFSVGIFSADLHNLYQPDSGKFTARADEEKSWRILYSEILENVIDSDSYSESGSMFDLFDINDDGIPELFISNDTSTPTSCDIYTVIDNSAVNLGKKGFYGKVRFNNIKGVLLSHISSTGLETDIFTKFENGTLNDVLTATNNIYSFSNFSSLTPEQVEFTMNGEKTTYQEYASALAEYNIKNSESNWHYFNSYADYAYIEIGRKYKLTSDVIASVMNEKGWKSAYANILRNTDKKYFSLCYIDDDDIPELVLHFSTGMGIHYDTAVELYTYRNNAVTDLGAFSNDGYNNFTYYRDRQGIIITGFMSQGINTAEVCRLADGKIYCEHSCSLDSNTTKEGFNTVDDVSYRNYSEGWDYFLQFLDFDEYIIDYGDYVINEENIKEYLSEEEIDPDVQAHLDWLEKNEKVFANEDFTIYLKDLMNHDNGTTVYKWSKIITDTDTLNNIDNEKLSVEICLSNLISSGKFSESMHNAGVESVCNLEEKILKFVEKSIDSGKSIKDILDVPDAYSKAAENLKSEFDFLVKMRNSASDTAEYVAKREKFISEAFGSCGKEFIPVVAEIAGLAIKEQLENQEIQQNFYDFCMLSVYYKGATDYMKNAIGILKEAASEKLYEMNYPAITTDMNVLRYRLVLSNFLECCSNLESADFDAYEYYSQLKKENKNKYLKKYTEAGVKSLVLLLIKAFAPEVALIIAVYEASVAVISIGTDIWELASNIDERTLERDKALNMFVMADVIDNAMLNSHGFAETLKNNRDRESLAVFEYGVSFYKTVHYFAINYSMRYFSMLSYKKAGFAMDAIAGERNRLNMINCHEQMLSVQVLNENFVIEAVKCPVNITVLNGTETAAKIENDRLVMTDGTCNIEIISEEGKPTATKIITYPVGYELKITGYGTGSMSISKITVSSGEISDLYTAENIPVEQGYSYGETKLNDVTKIGIDSDNDGNYDKYTDFQTGYKVGDVNGDGMTDASDASYILQIYSAYSTDRTLKFMEKQLKVADVNVDGITDASDASDVLQIYAAYSTGKTA